MAQAKKKKKEKKNIEKGKIHIRASFNNTIITVTDVKGNVIAWSSTGIHGFKGSRKSTPFAARVVAEDAIRKARDNGMKSIDIYVKGPGTGRESALRAIAAEEGLRITVGPHARDPAAEDFSVRRELARVQL